MPPAAVGYPASPGPTPCGKGMTRPSNAAISWSRRSGPSNCRSRDRKSTRLNSSHLGISYAVFCLKKKKNKTIENKKRKKKLKKKNINMKRNKNKNQQTSNRSESNKPTKLLTQI